MTVNVSGVWRKGHAEPLWVMSNLAPERALAICAAPMKIDESFKDLKNLLGLDKLMNKSQQQREQMAALTLITYAVGLLVRETLRDELYPPPSPDPQPTPPGPDDRTAPRRRKWHMYSGLCGL